MAGKLVEFISCLTCGRRQAFPKGGTLPPLWFETATDLESRRFITVSEALGGQGRGVKGKLGKPSGFQELSSYTLEQAWHDPKFKSQVQRLYKSAKRLVDFLEVIGVS